MRDNIFKQPLLPPYRPILPRLGNITVTPTAGYRIDVTIFSCSDCGGKMAACLAKADDVKRQFSIISVMFVLTLQTFGSAKAQFFYKVGNLQFLVNI